MNKRLKRMGLLFGMSVLGVAFSVGIAVSVSAKQAPLGANAAAAAPHIVGTWNSWVTTDLGRTLVGDDTNGYVWTGVLVADEEFKVLINDNWDNPSYGYWDVQNNASRLDGAVIDASGNVKVVYKNTYKVTYYPTSSETDFFEATYSTNHLKIELAPYEEASKAGVNNDRMRVFLDKGAHDVYGTTFCLQYTDSAGTLDELTPMIAPTDHVHNFDARGEGVEDDVGNNVWYAYYDIPVLDVGDKVRVSRISVNGGKVDIVTPELVWSASDYGKVLYVGDANPGPGYTLSTGIIDDAVINSLGLLDIVLEGYLSCSPSAANGFNAFPNINLTFFKKANGDWKTGGNLDTILITDFSGIGISGYSSEKGTAFTTDGWTKYTRLEAMYNAANPSGPTQNIGYFDNNNAIAIIIGIALVGLTSLAGLYLLKHKRA